MALQREFRGLPDHLGLYLAGRVPVELNALLNQSISAEDFVNPTKLFRFAGNSGAADVTVNAVVVPEGEFQRVRWMGCSWTNGASSAATFVPCIFHLDQFFGVTPFLPPLGAPATGSTNKAGFHFPGDGLVLEAGMGVSWHTQTYTGAGNVALEGIYQAQVIKI